MKIGENDILCPISAVCSSLEEFESEIRAINKNFENILINAGMIFKSSGSGSLSQLDTDIDPEKAWDILSSVREEKTFINLFNNLDPEKRREIADYILTRCNIFSGKGSLFSSRYDNETGLLE